MGADLHSTAGALTTDSPTDAIVEPLAAALSVEGPVVSEAVVSSAAVTLLGAEESVVTGPEDPPDEHDVIRSRATRPITGTFTQRRTGRT